jgi:hypothetical protein
MKKQINRIIVGLLVLSLMSYSLKAADTNSVFVLTSEQTPTQSAKPNIILLYCAVALAAGFVVYSVYRCAKSAGLTNAPIPPSKGTNSSSIAFPADDGPPTPPGDTNIYSGTNGGVSPPAVLFPNIFLATNNDANVETKWDVSTNGWTDWQGNPYTWLIITQTDPSGPHVQSSTNLTTWTDCYQTVYTWMSSTVSPDPDAQYLTNMTTVVCDGSGAPILTNFTSINPNATNNIGVRNLGEKMFFRGITP